MGSAVPVTKENDSQFVVLVISLGQEETSTQWDTGRKQNLAGVHFPTLRCSYPTLNTMYCVCIHFKKPLCSFLLPLAAS